VYLTFDVGTTSVKTCLYSGEGRLIKRASRDYSLASPRTGWYEMDPEVYWRATVEGFREIGAEEPAAMNAVSTISGCSQGETVIFLDGVGRPVRPAIVWYDNRARAQTDALASEIDREELYRITGIPDFDPMWTAPKLLWVKENEPELFDGVHNFLFVEDYIVYRLTGELCTTASLSSTSMLTDVRRGSYWDKTVDKLGIRKRLPRIVGEGSTVGTISAEAADAIGVNSGVVVVKGSMDQNMGAVGAGNIRAGILTETTGSALAICITVDREKLRDDTGLPYQPHAIPGKFLYLPYSQTSGIVYTWFRDNFAAEEVSRAGNPDHAFNELNRVAGEVPPGCEGLVFLPYLAGATYPENDSYVRGAYCGITLKHTRAHFARAIMEAIGFTLHKILNRVEEQGMQLEEVRSMGGGARSDLWLQIKADICRCPFIRMQAEETATLGAAITAAVSTGDYGSYEEAAGIMVRTGRRFVPEDAAVEAYKRGFAMFNDLYESLRPYYRRYGEDGG